MSEKDFARFTKLHTDGQLIAPEEPGYVLAELATRESDMSLSGKFLSYDSAELQSYRRPSS